MEEKVMVNDILETTKYSLKKFQGAILETTNLELRQTFQNLRNAFESFEYELFKLAESKGYYIPSQNATQDQVGKVKSEVTNL